MSEREGLYCEKHVKFWAGGVCGDCMAEPVVLLPPMAEPGIFEWPAYADATPRRVPFPRATEAEERALLSRQAAYGLPDCNHAAGYCKDTAHKYVPPVE